MSFETEKYSIIRKIVSADVLKHCEAEFELIRSMVYYMNNIENNSCNQNLFNDEMVAECFSYYCALPFEVLSVELMPLLETIVGKKLYPTYTYSRIYYNNAEMKPHTDRPSCEFSVSLCISNDENFETWPLYIKSNVSAEIVKIDLEPGDAVIYKGADLLHWREPYHGQKQCQAFFHYVDKDGIFKDCKFDYRPLLGLSAEYKNPYNKVL